MIRVQIINKSCDRRRFETEQIRNFLKSNGYSVCDSVGDVDPNADIIYFISCGFTKGAEDESFKVLDNILKNKRSNAQVIFGGCVAGINPERISKEFKGWVVSPQEMTKLNDILNSKNKIEAFKRVNELNKDFYNLSAIALEFPKQFDINLSEVNCRLQSFYNGFLIYRKLGKKRYYIQVQEGCSASCSYCAIRKAIGPLRSKPTEMVINEIKDGLSKRYTYIHLTGDNAGSYGLDIGTSMKQLLEKILEIEGGFILDLPNINPCNFIQSFDPLKSFCAQNRLCELYIPIQSANRRILKLMNRDCDMMMFKRQLLELKKLASSELLLGTTVMIGFPGETVSELDDTVSFCREVGFDWIVCHRFSARPGTPAETMQNTISDGEINKRSHYFKSQLQKNSLIYFPEKLDKVIEY